MRNLGRLLAALLVLAAAALGLGGWWFMHRRRVEPAPRVAIARGVSGWASITNGIRPDGTVPPEVALRAFSFAYDAAIPGVGPVPPRDGSAPSCAVAPLQMVLGHWSALTAEQRLAVERAAGPMMAGPRSASATGRFVEGLAAQVTAGDTSVTRWTAVAERALAALEARLHRPLGDRVEVRNGSRLAPDLIAGAKPPDWTLPLAPQAVCELYLNPSYLDHMNEHDAEAAIAHELFHCFQYTVTDFAVRGPASVGHWHLHQEWQVEGTASWVGEAVVGGAHMPSSRNSWNFYFQGREGSSAWRLSNSGYDAIGLFSFLAQHGVDVWGRILAVNRERDALSAFNLLVAGHEGLLISWASAAARRPAWGPEWNHVDPIIPAEATGVRTPDEGRPLRPGTPMTLQAEERVQRLISVPIMETDVVTLRGGGIGRVTFEGRAGTGWMDHVDARWCRRRGGCVCPDGSTPPGLLPAPPEGPVTVALFGAPLRGTSVTLESHPLDEVCSTPSATGLDPCLVGAWHIDRDLELANARAIYPTSVRVNRIGGDLTLTLDARGTGSSEYRQYCIETDLTGPMPMHQKMIFNGSAEGRYSAANRRIDTSGLRPAHLDVRSEITVNGQRMNLPVPRSDSFAAGALPGSTPYSCSEHELVFEQGARRTRYTR